jgi:hypothetical protein
MRRALGQNLLVDAAGRCRGKALLIIIDVEIYVVSHEQLQSLLLLQNPGSGLCKGRKSNLHEMEDDEASIKYIVM